MKAALVLFALVSCCAMLQRGAAAQDGYIVMDRTKISPVVQSIVDNFKPLLPGSTIIVVNTGGDEQLALAQIESFLVRQKEIADAVEVPEIPVILASIKQQFRTDKRGFSHAIWLSDDRATGNACVLGVRQNAPASYTTLVSKKIDEPLISGHTVRPLDAQAIQASVIAHEMYHCYEYLKGSKLDFWRQAFETRMAYAVHRSESAADAYAALYVLQNYDALNTLRTLMEFRRIGMLNSDVEHNSSLTVEAILKTFKRDQLAKIAPVKLIHLAGAMRDETIMDEEAFVALKKSSIELTGAYRSLLSEFQGLGLKNGKAQLEIESAQLMDDAPRDSQRTARVLYEITASFYKIGAGSAVSSRYYQPLLERYQSKEPLTTKIAAEETRGF